MNMVESEPWSRGRNVSWGNCHGIRGIVADSFASLFGRPVK